MKRLFIFFFLISAIVPISLAQEEEEDEEFAPKKDHIYFSLELLKTIPWLMIDNSYIIEPELAYRTSGLLISVQVGINDIKTGIYERLEYRNEGRYLKVGAGVDFSYFRRRSDDRSNTILGGNLIFASFDETGKVQLEENYFENPTLIQSNDARGIEIFFTYRRVSESNVFFSITPRIAYVMSDLDEEYFPTYYVPGFGVVNPFESSSYGHRITAGFGLKLGYRF